jgi:acyl-CoA reductase-like NAD-dependent aldehyde dehydrogenase
MSSNGSISLLPEVQEFLAARPHSLFIGGEFVPSKSGDTFETRNPGTGEVLTEVYAGDAADVDQAVDAAWTAFRQAKWARLPANERSTILHRLADLVEKHTPILGQLESLDCGKILAQAEGDIGVFVSTLRYCADIAVGIEMRTPIAVAQHEAYTSREPYGACGFIFPWNFPFLLVGWGVSPALAAGSTVVIKPAEDTPLTTTYLGRLVKEAGIPDGVVNIVPGLGETAGDAMAKNPKFARMSFTGSPEIGKHVAKHCGENLIPVKLELGGKGAAVVFDDVDIDDTADKLAGAITFHTGQVCCTATRWLVQESIYNKLINACSERMAAVQIGNPMAADSQMGPVVSAKQQDRVLSYIKRSSESGAEPVLAGGAATVAGNENGFYVKPAILSGPSDNVACREEIFGPVTYVMPFKSEDEAVELVNQSRYGLANSVWSTDLDRAQRVAESMVAGNSWINAHNVFAQGVPYGGVNLSGMGGGVNSPETVYDYLRPKSVVRPLA